MPENPLKPSGWRERLALRVLESLSRPAGTADSIAEILRVIVEETGIQSAGIRLRDGDDFPFHVFHGLTEEFVRAENNLAPVAPGGTCATDAQGDPALACLCGVVLEGRTDGGPGFFTPGGSFYAGHLQGQIGEIDLDQVPAYRPRCVLTGIETQALIPLREQAEIIGLLHLSDRRTEVLSRDDVEFMERLSASIGMALARQRAESTENRWRAVIQNEPECVKLLDREGRLLDMNPAGLAMIQASLEQVKGHQASGLVAPEDRAAFEEMVAGVFRGERRHLVFDMIGLQGRRLSLETTSVPLWDSPERKRVTTLLGVTRDITERKRADEALRQSEARLKEAQRIAGLGNWELDLVANTLTWSDEIFRIFEIDKEHFGGSYDAFLAGVHPEDRDAVNAAYTRSLETREPYEITHRLLMPDGRTKYVQEKCVTYYSLEGRPLRSVGTVQDITERKRLEEQLRQAQKMEAIGQLAGGVAHDFNNILAAAMMNLDALLQNQTLDSEAQETLADLSAETKRAATLTRQLLMFSRQSVLEVQALDLNEVVTDLLNMAGRMLGELITVRFEPGKALPAVEADAGMLEQVLMNLVVNARDAMPLGGRITLATRALDVDPETVVAHPDRRAGRFVCLSVSDTGCGMDDSTRKRVFEPFFTTKGVGKGTGLGLATVHGIVAQHRGWVDLESLVGEGTTFRVYLPASTKLAKEMEESVPEVVPRGRETLLVVEDEAIVRQVLALTLRTLGYRVLEAANGQEAMTLWRDHGRRIDLLLTDMVMPEGMTGLELARRVRAEKPELKVIVSSGYSAEMTEDGKVAAGGIVYLQKPYHASMLGKKVRECLDRE